MHKAFYAIPIALVLVAVAFFVVPQQQAQAFGTIRFTESEISNMEMMIPTLASTDRFYNYSVAKVIDSEGNVCCADIAKFGSSGMEIKYTKAVGHWYDIISQYLYADIQFVQKSPASQQKPGPVLKYEGETMTQIYFYYQKPDGLGYATFDVRNVAKNTQYSAVQGDHATEARVSILDNGDLLVQYYINQLEAERYIFQSEYVSSIKVK